VDGLGDKTKPGQLVLTSLLGLISARGRRTVVVGVVVEVAKGGEEGALLGLSILEVLLLERLLIESSLRLVLVRGVLALVLALARVKLVRGVLVLLGAMGDKVVVVSIAIACCLRTTITPVIQAVVVKPREPVDDQC